MIETIFVNPWIWIAPIAILICATLIVLGIYFIRKDDLSGWMFGLGFGAFGFVVITIQYFGFALVPYDSSYYPTYRITGEITEIKTAFDNGNGTVSQVFIVKVNGIDIAIKSDDQRFRLLNSGDKANFICEKKFAYFQEPWYDCAIGGIN